LRLGPPRATIASTLSSEVPIPKFLALCLLISLPAVCQAQALSDQVPADAVLYIGWHGVDSSIPGYEQSHLKALVDASQVSQLLHESIPNMVRRLAASDANTAQIADECLAIEDALWKYPVAFYLEGMDSNQPIPKIALICQAGGDSAGLADKITKLLAQSQAGDMVHCKATDQLLIVSTFDVPDHPDAPLSAAPEFQASLAALGKNPFVVGYIDGANLLALADKGVQMSGDPQAAQFWPKIRASLGLDGIKSLGFTAGFDARDWSTQIFVDAPAPRQGLLGGASEPISDDMLKLMPDTSNVAGAVSLDISALVPGILSAAAQVAPDASDQLNQGVAMISQMVGFDVQKEFLGLLGKQWGYYADPTTAGQGTLGMIIINRPTDPDTLASSLGKLETFANTMAAQQLQAMKMTIEFRQFTAAGVQVHYLASPMISPCWAIKDGSLMIGLEPQTLVGALGHESDGKSILDNPAYQAVRKQLNGPDGVSSFSFMDLQNLTPLGYQNWVAASRLYLGLGDLFGLQSPPLFMPPLQTLLAETEPAGSISWTDDAGLHLKIITPYPGAELVGAGNGSPMAAIETEAVTASILLPSLNRARETANRVKSASNLRMIGLACMQYSNDHQGALPPDLGTLIKTEDVSVSVFISPLSSTSPPPDQANLSPDDLAKWVNDNSDYTYVGAGKNMNQMQPTTVLAYEKDDFGGGRNFLYGDYHVDWQDTATAEQIINSLK